MNPIGPYDIQREIGRGGMGVVYLARDTKLDRDVAIKALPLELADDADRLVRFEREAKTLAQLNHPNVAGIHGVEEQDGQKYLILEYVEGETLAERLDRGALPVDEALEVAIEIAAGVEAAHEAGIIHRDLKPDNIKITPDGKVKVLDFGLARTTEGESGSSVADAATVTSPTPRSPTNPGAILGTAPYMSPEQARGRRLDKRSDIWSFGVILYEMLVGISPFAGETATDSLGAVLHKDIEMQALPTGTPPRVHRVLRRCLARDKTHRYHDIGDAALDLSERLEPSPDVTSPPSSHRLAMTGWLVALIAIAAVIVLSIRGFSSGADTASSVTRLEMSAPPDTQFIHAGDLAGPPVVSPAGDAVVFVAKSEGGEARLWIRGLNSGTARVLPGTEGANFPFWSPDSRSIGFFIRNQLKRHDLESGASYKVCDALVGRGGTWTPDGEILFAPGFQQPIVRVSADGGEPTPITTLDESLHTSHRWPFMLPDGKRFLFNAIAHNPAEQENNMLMVGSLDGAEPAIVLRSPYRAEYVNGMLLYVVENDLVAARLDLDTLTLDSRGIVLAASILPDPSTWYAAFSASANGVLACVTAPDLATGNSAATAFGTEANIISIVDRGGVVRSILFDDLPHTAHNLSHDGSRLAITAVAKGQQGADIWVHETGYDEDYFDRGDLSGVESMMTDNPALKRVTSKPGLEVEPVWSANAREIAFGRHGGPDGSGGIFIVDTESSTERRILPPDPRDREMYVTDWTRDGAWIVYIAGKWNDDVGMLYAVRRDGGEPVLLVEGDNRLMDGNVSPDGRWLAFTADPTGEQEAYVIPFAPAWPDLDIDPAHPEPIWRVSNAGGEYPWWRDDGRELLYFTSTGSVIAVPTRIEGDFFGYDAGVRLFDAAYERGTPIEILPGGELFILSGLRTGTNDRVQITLNWPRLVEGDTTP